MERTELLSKIANAVRATVDTGVVGEFILNDIPKGTFSQLSFSYDVTRTIPPAERVAEILTLYGGSCTDSLY